MSPRYQPFWCEENIWHLAADPAVGAGERYVVWITGDSAPVACWAQRAAPDPNAPVLWDYHVVLAVRDRTWQIWDLDSRLGYPCAARAWLGATFPHQATLRAEFCPRFNVVRSADFRRDFTSDRSHMRTALGDWQQPPPSWPLIQGSGVTIAKYVAGAQLDLAQLECWLAERNPLQSAEI